MSGLSNLPGGVHLDNTLVFESSAPEVREGDLEVLRLEGREALSALYTFDLDVECTVDGGLPPDTISSLLQASAQVGFGPAGLRRVHGVIEAVALLNMQPDGRRSWYRLSLRPRFYLASLCRRSRAFLNTAVPDVLRQVFSGQGMEESRDFELRLGGDYPAREYVVQYEESDFHFASRWMERVGMFYWFEHTDEGDKLVVADHNEEFQPAPQHAQCTYSPKTDEGALGAIQGLTRRSIRLPEAVHVRDYNWRAPTHWVEGEAGVDAGFGRGRMGYYGDHVGTEGDATDMARRRAEGFLSQQHVHEAWTLHADFAPGCRFTLTGAPMGELDIEYVLTEVRHEASQDTRSAGSGAYRNTLCAIPMDTPYRAPRTTRWPRIAGVVQAKIDAETVSAAAPIDDQGRYRVVLPFDHAGRFGGRASRWIRKAEPYAGAAYGTHFTLHAGAEVLLAHLNGDPDRPVIVGAVPNATHPSPVTDTYATRSALRSRSGILFDFEDDA